MANILNALLGQPDNTPSPAPTPSPDISAGLGGYLQNPEQGVNLSPQTSLSGDASARPFTHYETVKKHGLKELLSIAGDMALSSAGLQPQYLPSLHTAKIADALEGFQDDPSGAINRLTGIDPSAAEALYNDTIQNTYKRALTGQSVAAAQKTAQDAVQNTDIYKQKVFSAAASMVNASNPKTYAAVRKRAVDFLNARGASQFADGLPEAYDKDAVQAWANSSVPVDKQVDNARQQEALDNTEEYQDRSLGLRSQEVGIQAQNSRKQVQNIDSEIADRLWRQHHGDQTGDRTDKDVDSKIKHRQWLEDHPTKGRASSPTADIPAVGFKNSNGLTFQGGDPNVRTNWKRL